MIDYQQLEQSLCWLTRNGTTHNTTVSVMTEPNITLYGIKLSGHAHRVEALLNILELPFRYQDTLPIAPNNAELLALNPLGQIPVLTDGDLVIADSNAILIYLAQRYDSSGRWYPDGALEQARIQRWLSIAAGEIRFGPALARAIALFGVKADKNTAQVLAGKILGFMNQHLAQTPYLAGGEPTLADIACYAYMAHAPEGGVSLQPYHHVRAWLNRVESLPRFKGMPRSGNPIPS